MLANSQALKTGMDWYAGHAIFFSTQIPFVCTSSKLHNAQAEPWGAHSDVQTAIGFRIGILVHNPESHWHYLPVRFSLFIKWSSKATSKEKEKKKPLKTLKKSVI